MTLKVPDRAHPLVKVLFEEMNRQKIGLTEMSDRSGYSTQCIKDWRTRYSPNIRSLEACFGVLGMEIRAIEKEFG